MNEMTFAPLNADELAQARVERPSYARTFEAHDGWQLVVPTPDGAPPLTPELLTSKTPRGFKFVAHWHYDDAQGRRLCTVARFDPLPGNGTARKQYWTFTLWKGPHGQDEWRAKALPAPRPLYGLQGLADRPNAPVLLLEGEKACDAAAQRFPDYVCIASHGGSRAACQADWTPLAGRTVSVWPDHDAAGRAYAAQVIECLHAVNVANVASVAVPERWPDKWDLADALPEGVTAQDLSARLREASTSSEGPLPLFPPLTCCEPYPVENLGPVLARAAQAIANKVQVSAAIAAQSVLAVAALAAQVHAEVRLPFGQTRPVSLFFVSVAGSGDRKSTADNEALWPVRAREKALREIFESEIDNWRIEHAAWSAEKNKITSSAKLDRHERKSALTNLGPEPRQPLLPLLTAPDATIEGLVKAWINAPAALGLFSAEGGQFVGGHGMSDETKLRTAASLSGLWDGTAVKRLRAGDGVTILHGRRLSLHVMIQPGVATAFLADPILRDQGLLSRMLLAAPDTMAGTRDYRDPDPADEAAIKAYGARILALLESAWPLADGTWNELEPRVLSMSPDATALWVAFFNHVERQSGKNRDLAIIRDFASKAAEHAARIAAVIQIVEDAKAQDIGAAAMACGTALADWYVNEALRLAQGSRTDPRLLRASGLLEWLQARSGETVTFREILQFGPGMVRTKDALENAIGILTAHGWLIEIARRPRAFRLIKGEA